MHGSKRENGSESREGYVFGAAGVEKINCSRAAILARQLDGSTLRLTISFSRDSVRMKALKCITLGVYIIRRLMREYTGKYTEVLATNKSRVALACCLR